MSRRCTTWPSEPSVTSSPCDVEFREIERVVDGAIKRSIPGGERLSPKMADLLGLVIFQGYKLFPGNPDVETKD